jgi:hypothetical protein
MKNLISLIILVTLATIVNAQSTTRPYPDSIRVEFSDHQAIVVFEMKYLLRDQEIVKTFPATLNELLIQAKKGLPQNLATVEPHHIDVRHYKSKGHILNTSAGGHSFRTVESRSVVTLSQLQQPQTTMTITKGTVTELLPPGWRISIAASDYKITVYGETFASLEAITQETFDAVIQKILDEPSMKKIGKNAIISRAVIQNKVVAHQETSFIFPGDFLGLHPGGSVGVLNNTLYPEFFFKTAFYFSDRFGARKERFEITYDLSFFTAPTESGFGSNNNAFLSASYARNFRKANERPRWIALGAGYLIHNGGYPFTGKTMKIFMETDIGSSKLNIVPEFYLTNDFKKGTFGMKLQYKF